MDVLQSKVGSEEFFELQSCLLLRKFCKILMGPKNQDGKQKKKLPKDTGFGHDTIVHKPIHSEKMASRN